MWIPPEGLGAGATCSLKGNGRDAKTETEGLFEKISLGLREHHLFQSVDPPPSLFLTDRQNLWEIGDYLQEMELQGLKFKILR